MDTTRTVLFEREGGLARITLNRPARLNSFTEAMHGELARALDEVAADPGLRAVLLTGAGRGFCAGQDLTERAMTPGEGPVDLGRTLERLYAPLVRRLTELPKPVVCAVNGVAAGAGACIALACDLVLAGRSARFIQSFAALGLVPDTGGTWLLPRLAGQARALGMALTGEPVGAEQAERWGLIWKCVEDERLAEEAGLLAGRLAEGPTRGYAETKRLIRTAWSHTLDEQLDRERGVMSGLGTSEDYREGVAAFLARRPPAFSGR